MMGQFSESLDNGYGPSRPIAAMSMADLYTSYYCDPPPIKVQNFDKNIRDIAVEEKLSMMLRQNLNDQSKIIHLSTTSYQINEHTVVDVVIQARHFSTQPTDGYSSCQYESIRSSMIDCTDMAPAKEIEGLSEAGSVASLDTFGHPREREIKRRLGNTIAQYPPPISRWRNNLVLYEEEETHLRIGEPSSLGILIDSDTETIGSDVVVGVAENDDVIGNADRVVESFAIDDTNRRGRHSRRNCGCCSRPEARSRLVAGLVGTLMVILWIWFIKLGILLYYYLS